MPLWFVIGEGRVYPSGQSVLFSRSELGDDGQQLVVDGAVGGDQVGHHRVERLPAHAGGRVTGMGVGHPGVKELVHGYVLSDFHKADRPWVEALCDACADALPFLASGDDERYQAEVMRLAPAPKADPRRASRDD